MHDEHLGVIFVYKLVNPIPATLKISGSVEFKNLPNLFKPSKPLKITDILIEFVQNYTGKIRVTCLINVK